MQLRDINNQHSIYREQKKLLTYEKDFINKTFAATISCVSYMRITTKAFWCWTKIYCVSSVLVLFRIRFRRKTSDLGSYRFLTTALYSLHGKINWLVCVIVQLRDNHQHIVKLQCVNMILTMWECYKLPYSSNLLIVFHSNLMRR